MSIIRKRNVSNTALLPCNARDNQYILVQFPIDDTLIDRVQQHYIDNTTDADEYQHQGQYHAFYQHMANCFFNICKQYSVKNVQFIANDKLARVRFSQEIHQWQTNQQIYFYYNPSSHQLNKTFFDGTIKAQKISLLFLASGLNIYENSSSLHHKAAKVAEKLASQLTIDLSTIRLRDHQHITYDIFAQEKGALNTKTAELLPINLRYNHQNRPLQTKHSGMNYAVVSMPITNHLLNLVDVDHNATDPYNPLYTFITEAFSQSAKQYNLNNGALIANGLIPVIRYCEFESVSANGELQMLGYNPNGSPCGLMSKWDANELVDNVYFIFVAKKDNPVEQSYTHFLSQVEQALTLISTELELTPNKETVTMRFHQHIAYNLA